MAFITEDKKYFGGKLKKVEELIDTIKEQL